MNKTNFDGQLNKTNFIATVLRSAVTFLFRDDFTTDESAPIASPRTAEPGPGTWNLTDTANKLSISSGRLQFSGINGSADPRGFETISRDRLAGLSVYNVVNRLTGSAIHEWGYDDTNNSRIVEGSWSLNNTVIRILIDGVSLSIGTLANNTDLKTYTILRNLGAFFPRLVESDWILEYVDNNNLTNPIYIGFAAAAASVTPYQYDNFRVSQLPTPWDTDYGIATDRLAGARTEGDTFTHEADCLIEFEATTIPTSASSRVKFRIDSTPNFWMLIFQSTGSLTLWEIVANSFTLRGTGSNTISDGSRVVAICEDEEIKVYADNVLVITYSSAVNFKTATEGSLHQLGVDSSISDIISWPRVLSGDAKDALDAVSDA